MKAALALVALILLSAQTRVQALEACQWSANSFAPYDIDGLDPIVRTAVIASRVAEARALERASAARRGEPNTHASDNMAGGRNEGDADVVDGYAYGITTSANGDRWAGTYVLEDGDFALLQRRGPAVLVLGDGRRMEGEFERSRLHGYGVLWDASGNVIGAGLWTEGELTASMCMSE